MGTRLRIIVVAGVIISLTYIISMLKKEKLELKYLLAWLFAAVSVLVIAIFPESMVYIADVLNIATPINALFFVGICFILIILFSLTTAMSRNSRKLKDLVQKVALMEHEDEKVIDKQKED